MIKVTRTIIKPNSEIDLYSLPAEHYNQITLNKQEGKLLNIKKIVDGLQTKYIWTWDSIDSFNEFKNNSTYKIELEAYNLSKGIISTEEMEEISD